MKETIFANLKEIEQSQNVRILYACEVGSRVWGLASESSDYDVRFLYVHPQNYYLSIDPIGIGKKRDVIEMEANKKLDINGWELTKALRLFRKSNPTILEWLHSPIVYYEAYSTVNRMKELIPNLLDEKSCILHYLHMAIGNYEKIGKEHNYPIKTIINVLRPLLICKWLESYHEFPPLNFQQLVNQFIPIGVLRDHINLLINIKTMQKEEHPIDYPTILQYCYVEINRLKDNIKLLKKGNIDISEKLNDVFRKTLIEIDVDIHFT